MLTSPRLGSFGRFRSYAYHDALSTLFRNKLEVRRPRHLVWRRFRREFEAKVWQRLYRVTVVFVLGAAFVPGGHREYRQLRIGAIIEGLSREGREKGTRSFWSRISIVVGWLWWAQRIVRFWSISSLNAWDRTWIPSFGPAPATTVTVFSDW